jgi:hypothetical protein
MAMHDLHFEVVVELKAVKEEVILGGGDGGIRETDKMVEEGNIELTVLTIR